MRVKVTILVITICLTLALFSSVAMAGETSQAREVARMNNCPPKKIEVFQQALGNSAKVTYRVDCIMPKATGTKDSKEKPPESILVSCEGGLCDYLRPYVAEKK